MRATIAFTVTTVLESQIIDFGWARVRRRIWRDSEGVPIGVAYDRLVPRSQRAARFWELGPIRIRGGDRAADPEPA